MGKAISPSQSLEGTVQKILGRRQPYQGKQHGQGVPAAPTRSLVRSLGLEKAIEFAGREPKILPARAMEVRDVVEAGLDGGFR